MLDAAGLLGPSTPAQVGLMQDKKFKSQVSAKNTCIIFFKEKYLQ